MVDTLVVDDDLDVLEFVAALLGRAGHEVTTSANGLEAFDLLLAEDFDLCVLDHELPGLTGLEIAGAFRETGRDTRFVLVSGLSRLKLDGVEPVHQFVRKPFDPDHFLTIVEELLAT